MRIIFLLLLILEASSKLSSEDSEENKFNVVLFLADNSIKDKPVAECGMDKLKFTRKQNIKDCTPELESKIASSVPDFGQHISNSCNCVDLLKNSLLSLINYCRNVAGMTTVLASLNNDSFSNDLRFRKKSIEYFVKNSAGTVFKRIVQGVFPGRRRLRGEQAGRKGDEDIITTPEHTETFKIRTKRQEQVHSWNGRIKNDPVSKWRLLGIIESMKMTFLGKLLDNGDDENIAPTVTHLKSRQDNNCLFDLVSNALNSLTDNCEKGFLMIVIGGNLTDVQDVYSPLMMSVKHVMDNTYDNNTLLVVTGNCPQEEFEKMDIGLNDEVSHTTFPVFVKGAHCESLTDIFELYDIPYSLKAIISSMLPAHDAEPVKIDFMGNNNKITGKS